MKRIFQQNSRVSLLPKQISAARLRDVFIDDASFQCSLRSVSEYANSDEFLTHCNELTGLTEHLRRSAVVQNWNEHWRLAYEAHLLSRRIRLRLGNPFRVSIELRQELAELFVNVAGAIEPSVTAPAGCSSIDVLADNLRIRADHLLHPEKTEQEVLGLSRDENEPQN